MKLTAKVEAKKLIQTLRQVQPLLKKDSKELVRAGAKLAIRKAMEMTPPFDMKNADNSLGNALEAKKRGENAIMTDAFGGKRGAQGKTKRSGIFFVANEGMLRKFHAGHPSGENEKLFVKKDGTVWGAEKRYYKPDASTSDMDSHHAQYWRNGRMTSGGSRDRTIGRWVFVDRMVVGKGAKARWLSARYKRVGYLAAGWLTAANELKLARVPAWIKRHTSAPGDYKVDESESKYKVYLINSVKFAGKADLNRVIPYALRAARFGMQAQAKHIALKALKKAGFTTTAVTFAAI